MKTIKILFASLIMLFIISSCDDSVKKETEPAKITTIEILENYPKDTVVIAKSEDVFYVINDEQLVEYKLYGGDGHNTVILMLFLLGIVVGVWICFIVGAFGR